MFAACHRSVLTLLTSVLCATLLLAADWPQWRGPERNEISKETGLLKTWPDGGPKLLWKAKKLGGGYCTPSIAHGRIYGMSYRGDDEVVWALNESDGVEAWKVRIAKADKGIGYGEGSRCTPTIDGDRLYALGTGGDLVCIELSTQNVVWHKNLKKDFDGHVMSGWGYSESPLVDGDRVIATPGGKSATLVALNKNNGDVIWKSQVPQEDGAAYASVIIANVGGMKQYVQFLGGGVVGIDAKDGKFLWRYDKPHNGTANCSTAIFANDSVFAASAYSTGGGLVKLTRSGDKINSEEVYFTKKMMNHHGGMVLVDGYLYGANENVLTCLEFSTGKVAWQERKPGKGSLTFAEGCLYFRNEGGPTYLIEANPKQYNERGKFNPPDRSNKNAWSHPVVANGKLYLLDQDVLLCYNLKP